MPRLRRADLARAGITRRRCGRGFAYQDPDGDPLRDAEVRARIDGLVIPPAWREVWISPHPDTHIQAVGVDDAGRRQYIYHERWRRSRDEEKHDRVLELAGRLPEFRRQIHEDLSARGLERRRVIAGALRMLDRGVFRTGNEEYADSNGTYGVSTLLREHVTLRRGAIVFDYPAKGGIERKLRVTDPDLARLIGSLRRARTGSTRLLVCRDSTGWCDVRADDVNERFRELVGAQYSAKDLRTWSATVLAAVAFAGADKPQSKTAAKRAEAAVMREVAEHLGNTPAVARRSYVDPRVVRYYQDGRTLQVPDADLTADEGRNKVEAAVVQLLT
jgi:DNA topoisomerase IB